MRRAIAMAACLCITTPALADPTPPPHPVDPLPPAVDTPPPQPPAQPRHVSPPPSYQPPGDNPALPVVTVSTMPVPVYARDPDTESRLTAWIGTGVVAALAIAVEGWWLYRDKFESRGLTLFSDPNCKKITGLYDPNCYIDTPEQQAIHDHNEHVWNYTELGLASALGVSAFVTAYLWSRHYHPLHQVGFTPANGGGSVWIGGPL